MKAEIRERIEKVRRGEIPDGYRRTRAGIMPEDWISTEPLKAVNIFKNYTNKRNGGDLEVLSATQDRGIIPRKDVDIDIKYAEENISGYKKVDCGDFVISLRSFQGGIEYSEYEGLVSPAYTVLKPIQPIVNGYYKAYFKTDDFISRLNATVYGIRDGKQIGYGDFCELLLHYPPISEQQRIAEILTHCDKIIELKKQLIDEKRHQKKWLMQNLLNPESGVRVPGFEDKWKEYTLDDICTVVGGGTPDTKNTEYWNGDIPWISSSDITEDEVNVVNATRYITQEALVNSATQICPKGTILVVSRVGVGKIAIAPFELCTSQDFTNLTEIRKNVYFTTMLLKLAIEKKLKFTQGTSIKGITIKEIKAIVLQFPSMSEQTAIAEILSSADIEIDLLEQELAQWQAKKKSLMQLLLTGLVRVTV